MKNKLITLFHKEGTKSVISSLIAIILGLIFGFIIILIANPSQALDGLNILLTGGFYQGMSSLGDVIYLAVPIMMTGLSVSFAYKCGEFNIGVPGQYLVGCFVAVFVGLKATFIPDSILWLVAILCAGIAGALWALIPGILKAFKNVNVVISGIMCNYIGMLLVIQGIKATIYNSTGAESYSVPASKAIPAFGLDKIFAGSDVNFGIVIAILLCILAWVIMNKTTFGYELKACGFNKDAAKYAGMNEKKCVIFSLMIAGFFAGVGGAIAYLSGTGKTLGITETLPNEGWNGIPVALLGFSNPIGCIFAALFIGYINVGGNFMQSLNIAVEVIDIIVAVIIYFASFTLFIKLIFEKMRQSKEKKRAEQEMKLEEKGENE